MKDDKPIDRRRFFREGLRELFKPLAASVEPLEEAMHQLGRLEEAFPTPPPRPPVRPQVGKWLRPPGALEERSFLDTCSRCAKCVNVCPAQCIKIDATGVEGAGAPYIDPDMMPCVVCDGLHCMQECPSGALVPTALAAIDMGTAVWNDHICLRATGENCTICVDECPVGEVAIKLRDGQIDVIEEGCIGCGVCQNRCPTDPKSIVVVPRGVRHGEGMTYDE